MMLSPDMIQGIVFFAAAELLANYLVFRTDKPDGFSLYLRSMLIIVIVSLFPQAIYYAVMYPTKIIVLVGMFATVSIAHITIMGVSDKEYINVAIGSAVGFFVGAILFSWGILVGIIVWLVARRYEIKIEVPPQARLGLTLVRPVTLVMLYFGVMFLTILEFGGII